MNPYRLVALALGALIFGVSPASWAQEKEQAEDLAFEDDLFVIKGEIQRPEVVVVIRRENLDKAFELELRENFLDRIWKAIEEDPF